MRDPLPTELVRALAARGLRLTGPVGVGSSGPRWGAVAADGARVTVTVLPPIAGPSDPTTRRLAVLDRLRHPGLVGVSAVLRLPGGRAALCPEVPGADLVTVGAARGPWDVGEVVTLVGAVAEALAVLHGAGLAHGDVAPANIVLRPDGLPVLVDLLGGRDEAGTRGFAAPERASGPATAPADVHALAAVGRHLLGAGAPDALRNLLAEAMDPDPARRPLAAELARRVADAAPAARITVPEPGVLAVAGLRRLAGDRPDAGATVLRPGRSRGRHRRRGRSGVVATAAIGVIGLGATIALTMGAGPGGAPVVAAAPGPVVASSPGSPEGPTPGPPRAAREDPRTAAVRLTTERARALITGDAAALAAVTVPGSPAARQDRLTALRLGRGEPAAGAALRMVVGTVDLVPRPAARPAGTRVRIAAYVTTGDPATAPAPAGVVVVLRPGPGGWRVSAVEP